MSSKDYKTFDLYDIFTPDELDHVVLHASECSLEARAAR